MLIMFNAETGPGEENDSSFVYKIINAMWGPKVLKRRSVTGTASNAYQQNNPFRGLEKEKLEFIYGLCSHFNLLYF